MSECDQSGHALKNGERHSVHGPVEYRVVWGSWDAELREELFITVNVGTELAIGHSRVDKESK